MLLPTAHCGLPTLRKIQLAGVVAAGEVAGLDFTQLGFFGHAAGLVVERTTRMKFAAAGKMQRAGDHAGNGLQTGPAGTLTGNFRLPPSAFRLGIGSPLTPALSRRGRGRQTLDHSQVTRLPLTVTDQAPDHQAPNYQALDERVQK